MKKILFFLVCLASLSAIPVSADINILQNDTHNLNFYGFIKFNAAYQTYMMNSYNAPRYPLPNTLANDDSSTNFSAMDSRFGLKWDGPTVFGDTIVKGCFEWDLFDGTSRNQMKLRTRLAYFELKGKGYSVIAGQHWDVFGAGLPFTLNTNGFYWETGNTGFRRAQLRYTRFWENGEFAISAGDPTTDNAIKNGTPLLNARYAFKFSNKGHLAISAAYGQEDFKMGNYPDRIDDSVSIWGVSVDAKIPFNEQFSMLGEVTRGQNMKPFLSRAGSFYDAADEKFGGIDATSGWIEFLYNGSKVDCYLGYSAEYLTDNDHISDGSLKDDDAIFVGIIHKLGKGVSYGAEITKFRGDYKEAENSHATQVLFSMKYAF